MIDLAVVGPPEEADPRKSPPVRSERDVVRVRAATARGGGAHRGRAVEIVVHRGRVALRLPLRGLARRARLRLIRPLLAALGPFGSRLEVLEALDHQLQLAALAAAVLVFPLIQAQPSLDEQLLALADRLQQPRRLLAQLAAVPDLAVDEDRLVLPLLRLLVELAVVDGEAELRPFVHHDRFRVTR